MLIVSGWLFLWGAGVSRAADKPQVAFHHYSAFEVGLFENPADETEDPLPDEWLAEIRDEIVERVIGLHRFRRVMDFVDPKVPEPQTERVLRVRGKIVKFSRGNRAKRAFNLFWGKGELRALCDFEDKASGKIIWQREVGGRAMGPISPTKVAIKGLAEELAGRIRKNW